MAVEARRGCGYRKVGGLYLVSSGQGVSCDRLPIRLDVCPVCSHGFKQSRGWTWVDLFGLVGGNHYGLDAVRVSDVLTGTIAECMDDAQCPLCHNVKQIGKAGLLWIGEKFYKTPGEFDREGEQLGFSRRVSAIPRGFKVGETWVMIAHSKTVADGFACEHCGWAGPFATQHNSDGTCTHFAERKYVPGIFTLWRPSRIEKILKESQRESDEVKKLVEQGITPVFVPDDDPDHQGTVYDKEEEEETATTPAA
jgi:hypothetical protein